MRVNKRLIKKLTHFSFTSVSLRDKLLFLFVGAMFVSMSILGMIMFANMYVNTRDSLSDNINSTVTAVSKVMDQSFLVTENLVLELAASSGVQKWLDDSQYYDSENPEFYLRKSELNGELQRVLIYSNAKKLDVVEYAAVFNHSQLLEYVDIQSVGEKVIYSGTQIVYSDLEKQKEQYVYTKLITNPRNTIFHIRRMQSDFDKQDELILMVATDEKDISESYTDLVQEKGSIVYLVNENNQILSSSNAEQIGEYIDQEIVDSVAEEKDTIELDQNYLLSSRKMRSSGESFQLIYLYPQKLLVAKVLDGIYSYVVLCIGVIIICILAALAIGYRSTQFLEEFIDAMRNVRDKNYDVQIKPYKNQEINRLGMAFNEMTYEIKELIQNKYESQILLNEMEIRFLQHQMNPHFLFNVLLTIQIRAKRSGDDVLYKMVSTLSALLRASIYTNKADIITVEEELKYTELYLYLQKMRFEDRMCYEINMEDQEIKKFRIPKFVIEPIVENAVVHGMENMERPGKIDILLHVIDGDLVVVVSDNGKGFDVEKYQETIGREEDDKNVFTSREKIGLNNVNLRLKHIYGSSYGIEIKSKINEGTKVYIKLPAEEKKDV